MSEEQAIEQIGKSRFSKRSLTPEQISLDKLRSALRSGRYNLSMDKVNEYMERISGLPNLRYMNMDRLAMAVALVDRIHENIGSYSPSPPEYRDAERGFIDVTSDTPNVRKARESLFSYSTIVTTLMSDQI
jgi:hypothetical protein